MKIVCTPKKEEGCLSAGKTVYIREFGNGPYVLIQPTDTIMLKGYRPDPRGNHSNAWQVKTHLIDDGWVCRDKKGNYLDFPASALTTEAPTSAWAPIASTVRTGALILGCMTAVTSPFWMLELITRCF